MQVQLTIEGLPIPKEVVERLGSNEVVEEPGRLLIIAEPASPGDAGSRALGAWADAFPRESHHAP